MVQNSSFGLNHPILDGNRSDIHSLRLRSEGVYWLLVDYLVPEDWSLDESWLLDNNGCALHSKLIYLNMIILITKLALYTIYQICFLNS